MNQPADGHNNVKSILTSSFGKTVEFLNEWFTMGQWLFRNSPNYFVNVEWMMIVVTLICVGLLFAAEYMGATVALVVGILLGQRVLEFLVIYSRNFILNRGRIFLHFHGDTALGEWMILMFALSLTQVLFVFATWYRLLSLYDPGAFNHVLGVMDSLYFSVVTYTTLGFGDITPLTPFTKFLVMIETLLTFYTLVIVINGLIAIHFRSAMQEEMRDKPTK